LFEGLADDDMMIFAKTIKEAVSQPYILGGHHAVVGASIGMSDSDLSGTVPEVLVSHAAMALSIADDSSGNAIIMFSKEMDVRVKGKQDMETALRAALKRGEFSVHYQPQVNLDTGEIIGVEALTRWTHPELGNIPPAEFIPSAEATGLIIELGRWVLDTACAEVAGWPKAVKLSVNVSPMQFEHGDIVSDVLDALKTSGLSPDRLDIEITESLLVAETSHVGDKLQSLRSRGVGVALDDFGTGYSSLSYLGRLPVDKIKIDQSFVRGLPEDVHSTAIVRAVLMLAESLDKSVVAEGIETQDQAWLLRLAGCKIGQGYFFGRPGPAQIMIERLRAADADKLADVKAG
jgi:predicted signal transduction protein with EAL and GGDEF domain